MKNRLRELREEKRLTQSELAVKLGISTSAIGMYEQGRRIPSLDTLAEMSKILDANIEYIMGRSSMRLHPSVKRATNGHVEELASDYMANALLGKLTSDERGQAVLRQIIKEKIVEVSLGHLDAATIKAFNKMLETLEDGEIKKAKLEIVKDILELEFTVEQLYALSSFIKSFKK